MKLFRGQLFLIVAIGFLCQFCFSLGTVFAQESGGREYITSFDSWIDVEESGTIKVVETIEVIARGNKIKRGIYRDFPTDYRTPSGSRMKVGFKVLAVQRDGESEPYHTREQKNGVRVYIGQKDVFINPGKHTFTIIYETDRQVGFFEGYDELYWNVTGNGWDFAIEKASATLNLPRQAIINQHSVYTGPQGSTASHAVAKVISGSEMHFETTKPLGVREGLTFAAAWQKGVIVEPELKDKAAFFFRDNHLLIYSAVGFTFLLLYYFLVWIRVGKDPAPDAIIPRFNPPSGFSPAAARFVMRMGFDNKAFAAALVNLGVKQYLSIDEDKGTYTLKRSDDVSKTKLSRGERKIAGKLFAGADTVVLKQGNHAKIRGAITALQKSLQTDFEKLHFKRNRKHMVPGVILTVVLIVLMFLAYRNSEVALFMSVWLTGWTAGCYALLVKVFNAWKVAITKSSGFVEKGGAAFLTLFSLPFVGGWITGFTILVVETSIVAVSALTVVLVVNFLFYHLLKAPTIKGRRVMDKLDGLKMFLTVAEKDRLNLLNPPEKTPELFEKMLPWALALDVEQQWSEQFSDILARAAVDGTYSPTWYTGHHSFTPTTLASSLGTGFTTSISASSTAPGSSSGSGGGGSSGGGGGGGGGGGW